MSGSRSSLIEAEEGGGIGEEEKERERARACACARALVYHSECEVPGQPMGVHSLLLLWAWVSGAFSGLTANSLFTCGAPGTAALTLQ